MKNLLIFILLMPIIGYSQIIETVAGTGTGGFFGDSGLATDAKLKIPVRIAFDKFGNYYIADASNQRIRKVNITTGIITTIAGNGTAGYNGDGGLADTSELNFPVGIAVDTNLNVYIADQFNYRIRVVSQTTGLIHTYAGTGVSGFSGDSGLAISAKIIMPEGLCLDKSGNLYFTDGNRIRKVSTTDTIKTIVGTGTFGFSGDEGLADTAMINDAHGVAVDDSGNLYIADFGNNRIRKVSVSGIINTVAGNGTYGTSGDSGAALSAEMMNPADVAIDHYGNIYIAGYTSNMMLMVNTFGIMNIVAGNGTMGYCCDGHNADSAELNVPEGVAVDSCSNLYIPDSQNDRVRIVNFDSTLLHIAIIASEDTVCASTVVSYSVTNVTGGAALTYHWYVNGAATSSTSTTYTYSPANGDAVWCVCTSTNPCYGSHTAISDTIHMVVNPATVPTITVNAPVSAMLGSIVTVTATVAGAGSSYSIMWYDNGSWFATTTVPTTTYTKTHDIDTITATVASTAVGCYDSTTSSAWLVGDTSLGTTSPCPLQRGNTGVTVFPNPASGVITITSAEDITSVEVRNVYGQVTPPQPSPKPACFSGRGRGIGNREVVIDISMLPAGVYVVMVNGIYVKKVIKE